MKITVEKPSKPISSLERCLKITVPAEQVQAEKEKKYKELSTNAQLPGYRKGKVPRTMLEKRFGDGIDGEVKRDLVNKYLPKALEKENLTPVATPELAPLDLKEGESFEIQATFEIKPDIKPAELTELSLERFKTDIEESDIDEALEKLRQRHATWSKVDKAAKEGDRIKIDYVGTIKKETFEGGSAEGFLLTLGENKMIEGFEDKLIGAKAGDDVAFDIKFPKDYPAKKLAAKKAHFKIKVHEVEQSELPTLDDNFAKKLDVDEGLIKLREKMKQSMEQELGRVIHEHLKYQIVQQLDKLHPIEVPKVLLDAEITDMQAKLKQRFAQMPQGQSAPDISAEHLKTKSKRRIALSLIFGELVKKYEIKLDQSKLQKKLDEMAALFGGEREAFLQWFSKNESYRQEISMNIMEEQVMDTILEETKENTKDKPTPYNEAIRWRPPEDEL